MDYDSMKRGKMNSPTNLNGNNSLYACITRNLPSYKVLAFIGWSLLILDFYLHHTQPVGPIAVGPSPIHEVVPIQVILPPPPPDRSSSYHVKILPHMINEDLELLPSSAFSYMAMIDAGSSGCRVHVYRYGKVGKIDGPLYIIPKHVSLKVKPGLSSFAKTPQEAGVTMKGLVDFVKEKVPEKDWVNTPIWLKATAGLRMLESKESEAILDSVRKYLGDKSKSPLLFRPHWARIIPGQEEGAFGWIAYNYLKRIIGPRQNEIDIIPYAVIEMGGASAQVTQLAPTAKDIAEIPEDYKYTFSIEGQSYTLYTHSYLGFGSEQAREGLNRLLLARQPTLSTSSATATSTSVPTLPDPCLNAGYVRQEVKTSQVYEGPEGVAAVGASDAAGSCSNVVKDLFLPPPNKKCDNLIIAKSHSFGCVYQPQFLLNSLNFLVFENFYYIANGVGILPANHAENALPGPFPRVTSAKEMEESAREVCGTNWTQLHELYPKDNSGKDTNIKLCFISSLMPAFLVQGLGIDVNKQLTIQQSVGNSDIEWALGAAYKEAADLLRKDNLRGPTKR